MGSLGGDLTANIVNPAGLAFIKTNNILISPALQFGKGRSDFRGTNLTGNGVSRFALGTSGIAGNSDGVTVALTVTQRGSFNRPESYKGRNDYSSFGEPLGDEFAASQLTIDQALNSYDVSLTTKMALYTYLVDTPRSKFTSPGSTTG